MKDVKAFFLPILSVALLAAGLWLWQQRQEIDALKKERDQARAEAARRGSERAALEQRWREARDETTALRNRLAEAHDAPAEAETKSAASEAKPGAAKFDAASDPGVEGGEAMMQWLADANDPAVLRRLNLQARNKTLKRYDDLFKQLNLPPDQTDQLTKLLTDKRQAAMDVAVTSYQQGEDPGKDMDQYRDRVSATRADIEKQISALLGDNGYAQYQDYDRSVGQLNVLNNLQLALRASNEPLTPEQTTRFKETLQDSNSTRVSAKLIKDSRTFLSPVQVQALEDLRAVQQANSQKRNQPLQPLPNAPVASPPKPKQKP